MPITFEIEYLSNLQLDSKSCVYVEHAKEHLALHPFQLNNTSNSIKELLNKNIAKYCKHLNGILLGYDNIKLLEHDGLICDDSCYIHIDIEADFYVFKPEIDSTLQGVINKICKDHVACLVHKTFTISLPKPEDSVTKWIGSKAKIGQEVQFTIVEAVFEGSLPYIRGNIISLDNIDDSGFSTNEDQHGSEEYQMETPKEKKVIRKRKLTELIDDQQEEVIQTKRKRKKDKSLSFENDTVHIEESTKKKDKKHKRKKCPEDDLRSIDFSVINKEDALDNPNLSNLDLQKEEKKSKKRKRNNSKALEVPFEFNLIKEDILIDGKSKKRKRIRESNVSDLSNFKITNTASNSEEIIDSSLTKKKKHKRNSVESNEDKHKSTDKYDNLLKRLSLEVADASLMAELNDLLVEKRKSKKETKTSRKKTDSNKSIELDLDALFSPSSSRPHSESKKKYPITIISDIRFMPEL